MKTNTYTTTARLFRRAAAIISLAVCGIAAQAQVTVTTFAGSTTLGSADGTGAAAQFSNPAGIATDSAGNMYVGDSENHTIRKMTPAGVVTTFAGAPGVTGTANGTGSAARFYSPYDVVVDSANNVYVSELNNHAIRKITPAGVVSTFAGSPGVSGSADGTGSAALFNVPIGIGIDSADNLYVADGGNFTIRKITPAGAVTTVAGGVGDSSFANGPVSTARFSDPSDVVVDATGNLIVTDAQAVRKITPAGVVSTLAGAPGVSGIANGLGGDARFDYLGLLQRDGTGGFYVCDFGDSTLRRITAAGLVTTVAGVPNNPAPPTGTADGVGSVPRFRGLSGITVNSAGHIFVAEPFTHRIRKITIGTLVAPTVASPTSTGIAGTSATLGGNVSADGGVVIAERGIVIALTSVNPAPTIGGTGVTKQTATGTTGVFTLSATSLAPTSGYTFRAYAINSVATSYSPAATFTTVVPNTAPTDISLSNATIAENNAPNATIGTLTATDPDAGNTHTFALVAGVGSTDNAAFSITGNTLTINAAADFETKASYAIRIRTTDSGAGSLTFEKQFTITITDVAESVDIAFGAATFTFNPVTSTGAAATIQIPVTRTSTVGTASVTLVPSAITTVPVGISKYNFPADYDFVAGATANFAAGQSTTTVGIVLKSVLLSPALTKKGAFNLTLASPVSGTIVAPSAAAVTILTRDGTTASVAITGPAATTTAGTFDITGTVRDAGGLTSLIVKLNGVVVPLTVDPVVGYVPGTTAPFTAAGATPETGKNTISVESLDPSGNRATVFHYVTYTNTRPDLAGIYNATIAPVGPPDADSAGLVNATVTATGVVTGNARISGVIIRFTGSLNNAGAVRFNPTAATSLDLIDTTEFDSYLGALSLTVSSPGTIAGTLKTQATAGSVIATIAAPKALTTATAGIYAVALPSKAQTPVQAANTYPQGDGTATLTLGATGTVKLMGNLADGTPFTSSFPLRTDSTAPVYVALYKKQGLLVGNLAFANLADSDVAGTDLLWVRPAQTSARYYRAGWASGIRLDALGTKHIAPAAFDFGQGANDLINGNANLVFTDGLLPATINHPVNVSATTGGINALSAAYSGTLTGSTGIINGSFEGGAYRAVLINKGANKGGFGYFLSSVPLVVGASGESGGVSLQP